jgi:hypothetical protein
MAEVEDYTSGKILRDAKIALIALKLAGLPVIGRHTGKKLLRKIEKFEPRLVSLEEASSLIENAEKVAVGNRVCYELHNTDLTESVFLNELAEGMVKAGKARFVSKEEAIKILSKYATPIIVSRVSGKYVEICRSHPKTCVYWNAERKGIRCLKRR